MASDEIPKDIGEEVCSLYWRRYPDEVNTVWSDLHEDIARAILAERQRCAEIARDSYGPWDVRLPPERNARFQGIAIAAAIEKGEQ